MMIIGCQHSFSLQHTKFRKGEGRTVLSRLKSWAFSHYSLLTTGSCRMALPFRLWRCHIWPWSPGSRQGGPCFRTPRWQPAGLRSGPRSHFGSNEPCSQRALSSFGLHGLPSPGLISFYFLLFFFFFQTCFPPEAWGCVWFSIGTSLQCLCFPLCNIRNTIVNETYSRSVSFYNLYVQAFIVFLMF